MIEPVANGQIAAVVSYLECRSIPAEDATVLSRHDVALTRQTQMACSDYRTMFRDIGKDWLWFSRLRIDDEALSEIIHDSSTKLHTLHDVEDHLIGFLELNCTDLPCVHVSFLGVLPTLTGQGLGTYMMMRAFQLARTYDADHLKVQTCTLDHPGALAFYRKMGFEVTKREIEITTDPRLDGTLPRDAAPHLPLIDNSPFGG